MKRRIDPQLWAAARMVEDRRLSPPMASERHLKLTQIDDGVFVACCRPDQPCKEHA